MIRAVDPHVCLPIPSFNAFQGGTIIGSHTKPHMNNIGNSLHAKDYLDKHPQVIAHVFNSSNDDDYN